MADPRERFSDGEEAFRTAVQAMLAGLWVGGPGIIQSFNAALQTASVQPSIQGRVTDSKGNISFVNMPLCVDVPVFFLSGGGFSVTTPVKKGDECFIAFADRCIDSWWQNGGIQPPAEYRLHDLSDGFAFIGFRSNPRALTGVSTTSLQVRSDDGTTYFEVAPGGVLNAVAPGGMNITTPLLTVNGEVVITKTIQVENTGASSIASTVNGGFTVTGGDIVADGISLKTHRHTGVQTGGGDTGGPI